MTPERLAEIIKFVSDVRLSYGQSPYVKVMVELLVEVERLRQIKGRNIEGTGK